MTHITEEMLLQVQEEVNNADEEATNQMITQMGDEQPALLGYVLALGEQMFSEEEQELLLFLTYVVWKSYKNAKPDLRVISDEYIDQLDEKSMNFLNSMEEASEEDAVAIFMDYFTTQKNPELVQYLSGVVFSEEPGEEFLEDDETKGLMLFVLTNVIHCLEEAAA